MASRPPSREGVDPGAMLATTHELDDGSRVRLRLTRPSDLNRIEAFLDRLRAGARAREFAFYDPRERLTIAATRPGDLGEDVAGLATAAVSDPEPLVLVTDQERDLGLDGLLSQAVAELAANRQVRHG